MLLSKLRWFRNMAWDTRILSPLTAPRLYVIVGHYLNLSKRRYADLHFTVEHIAEYSLARLWQRKAHRVGKLKKENT